MLPAIVLRLLFFTDEPQDFVGDFVGVLKAVCLEGRVKLHHEGLSKILTVRALRPEGQLCLNGLNFSL